MKKIVTLLISITLIVLLICCTGTKYVPDGSDTLTVGHKITLKGPEVNFGWNIWPAEKDTVYYDRDGVELMIVRDSSNRFQPEVKCPDRDTVVQTKYVTTYLKPEPRPPKKSWIKWWHLVIALFAGGLLVKLFGK